MLVLPFSQQLAWGTVRIPTILPDQQANEVQSDDLMTLVGFNNVVVTSHQARFIAGNLHAGLLIATSAKPDEESITYGSLHNFPRHAATIEINNLLHPCPFDV